MEKIFQILPTFDLEGEPQFHGVFASVAARSAFNRWMLNHTLGREQTRNGFAGLSFEIRESHLPSADFLMGCGSGGIWSERAVAALKPLFDPCGDLYPTGLSGEFGQYFLFDSWERHQVEVNAGYNPFSPQTFKTLSVSSLPVPAIFVGVPYTVGLLVSEAFHDAYLRAGLIGAEFRGAELLLTDPARPLSP